MARRGAAGLLLLGLSVPGAALPAAAGETVRALVERGQAALIRGDVADGERSLAEALRRAVGGGDAHGEALALVGLANVAIARGETAHALDTLGRVRALARLHAFTDVESNVLANDGVLRLLTGRLGAADRGLREAYALAAANPPLRLRVASYLSRLAARRGDQDEARRWTGAAWDSQRVLARDAEWGALSLVLAKLLLDGGDDAAAGDLLAEIAREAGRRQDVRTESYAHGYLGQVAARAGRTEEGFARTRQAMFLADGGSIPELLYQWQWQLGRLERQAGHIDRAIERYRDSISTLAPIRLGMPATDPVSGEPVFRRKVGPVFSGLADLLLTASDDAADEDERQRRLEAAREAMEQFKTAEMEDYLRSACFTRAEMAAMTVRSGPGLAVLYPILLEDRLELLLETPEGLRHHAVPVTAAVLRAEVARFRASLEEYTSGPDNWVLGGRLYDRLIRPIEADLKAAGIETLIYLPDDALRLVPLAALNDGRAYVVEWLAVGVASGLRMLDAPARAGSDDRILLAGMSVAGNGHPALPGVASEIEAIRRLYPGEVRLNAAFTRQALRGAGRATPFAMMHFASHAVFSGNPATSYIQTYDGRITLDELEAFIRDNASARDKLDLLTLSACETAAGDDRSVLGLAGAALKGGVRSVFASLWPIADLAASGLLPEFYRLRREEGLSKVEALRRAQQMIRRHPEFDHPTFWAPFVIVGDWR